MLPMLAFRKVGHLKLSAFHGKDSPAAPDYSGIAAANAQSAAYAKEAADNQLAFQKQQYADNQPFVQQAEKNAMAVSDSQLQSMNDANARATDQWNQYKTTFQPIETKMAQEAMDAGGEADQESAAGKAGADVQQQSAIASQASNARLEAMGINPNSGNFAATANANALRTAATGAGAETNARTTAKNTGISLRAGAAAFGRNQTNTAGQQVGIGTNSGNSSVNAGNVSANTALPSAGLVNSGYGAQITAAGTGIQSQLGLGSLMNQGYGIQSQADAASSAGLGSFIGGGISAAATVY